MELEISISKTGRARMARRSVFDVVEIRTEFELARINSHFIPLIWKYVIQNPNCDGTKFLRCPLRLTLFFDQRTNTPLPLYIDSRDEVTTKLLIKLQSEECLKQEKDRVSHYLHSSSEPKLLEKVQQELLSVYATQLLEKEHSGCHALLRDDKVEDLSRMYRLFSKIPRGLDPISSIFKQHVTAEGTTLVKQAEDATRNKKIREM